MAARRTDSPAKVNLSLSAVCREQAADLVEHFQHADAGRRHQVTFSEVVERAVAALHQSTISQKSARRPARPTA